MMANWKKLIALPLMLSTVMVHAAEPTPAVLKVGVVDHVYPFSYIDEKIEKQVGFDIDITKSICDEMNQVCEIIPMRYIDLVNALETGELHVVVNGWRKITSRLESFAFTDPYYRSQIIFVTANPNLSKVTVDNVQGKTIGALVGSGQALLLNEFYVPKGAIFRPYNSSTELYGALLRGDVDLVCVSGFAGYEFLKRSENLSLHIAGMHRDLPAKMTGRRIAVHKDFANYVPKINRALSAIKSDGRYQAINLRYFEFMVY